MQNEVVITGLGIVSSIGQNQEEVLRSLQEGRSGVLPQRFLKTKHTQYPVGEVGKSNEELRRLCALPAEVPVSRATLLGLLAAREAVSQAGLDEDDLKQASFISGTCVGGMDVTEQHWSQLLETEEQAGKEDSVSKSVDQLLRLHPCGEHAQFIADTLGCQGYVTTISTACSSALNALIDGAELIRQGMAEIVIVGGAECLTNYHFNGFRTLHILSENPCRPFDNRRDGINLGEGAGYLVLESLASAMRRRKQPIAFLSGTGNACDAFHQTASSENGEGAYLAMQAALRSAHLKPGQVDYLNAHGTATPNNDLSESHAIQRVFDKQLPPVSSTKGFTGHTTAASGAIESVICLLAMQHNFIPQNINWGEAMEDGIVPSVEPVADRKLSHVMCNAFGFGGNESSVIFSSKARPTEYAQEEDKHLYVKRIAQISAQQPLSEQWLQHPLLQDEKLLPTLDPDFSQFLSAAQSRRLGPLLKRAMATALTCLQEEGKLTVPDAIVAGTGLGCIKSTETFLRQIQENAEELLNPTPFMQSTHNTISSQLAIYLEAHGYNNTYSHLDMSFDSVLADVVAQLTSSKNDWKDILVGGYDELTPTVYELLRKAGYGGANQPALSETAVSMLLSTEPSRCEITDILLPNTDLRSLKYLDNLIEEDDVLLIGVNGDRAYDERYRPLLSYYDDLTVLHYKHLFGESMSSSATGVYVAAACILNDVVPEVLHYRGKRVSEASGIVFVNYSYAGAMSAVRLQLNEDL